MKLSGSLNGKATLEFDSSGQLKSLYVAEGLQASRVDLASIVTVTQITSENRSSLSAVLGGVVAGTLIAGPLGGLVGAWLKSGGDSHVAAITFADDTTAIAQLSGVELAQLITALPRASRLREQAEAESAAFANWAEANGGTPPPEDPWAFLK